jgi:subtilisin family serine protease
MVAVVDSGVDAGIRTWPGRSRCANFVDNVSRRAPRRHGTAVAGIIAARAGNGVGIAGIAPTPG